MLVVKQAFVDSLGVTSGVDRNMNGLLLSASFAALISAEPTDLRAVHTLPQMSLLIGSLDMVTKSKH